MSEEELREESVLYRSAKNRFIVMLIGTILISLFLVSVALALYASSGAAQVDLSRPGYSTVRSQANEESASERKAFPNTGPINRESMDLFDELFAESSKDVLAVPAFDGDVLSDESLHISDPAVTE